MKAFLLVTAALITPSCSLPGIHSYVTKNAGLLSQPLATKSAQQLLDEAQSLQRAVQDEVQPATPATVEPVSLMSTYSNTRPAFSEMQGMMPPVHQAVQSGSATLSLESAMDMHDQIAALQAQVQTLSSALQRQTSQAAIAEERHKKLSAKAQELSLLAEKTVEEDGQLRQQLQALRQQLQDLEASEVKEKEELRKQAEAAKASKAKEHIAQAEAQKAKKARKASEDSLKRQQDEFKSQAAAVIKAANERVEEAESRTLKATSLTQQASSMVKAATQKAAEQTKAAEQKAASAAALEAQLQRSKKQIAAALQRTKEKVAKAVEFSRLHQQLDPAEASVPELQTPNQEQLFPQAKAPLDPRESQMSLQTSQIRKRVHAPPGSTAEHAAPSYVHMPASYETQQEAAPTNGD